ncbi:recT protein [Cryptobacterium sp. CAG:338]|jgi:recombination protein RecT|nr:recT protein [Cryptobacterium sp. CAG:338]
MGQLAQQAQSKQIKAANPIEDIRGYIQGQWPKIAKVLPKHMSPERMMQLAISTINKNPKLADCTVESVLSCFMTASSLGLEPNDVNGLGQCYIIPYGRKATFIPGYRGLYKLALNSGEIQSITVEVVYEGDEFEYMLGDDARIVHKPSMTADHKPENMVCAYCITRFNNGGIQRTVMSKADIERRRKESQSGKRSDSPWVKWYEEMAKKTVMRAASKTWPLQSEKAQAFQEATASDEMEGGRFEELFEKPIFEEQSVVEVVQDTEPKGLRKAVCKSCGSAIEVAADATLEDVSANMPPCCEKMQLEWAEGE